MVLVCADMPLDVIMPGAHIAHTLLFILQEVVHAEENAFQIVSLPLRLQDLGPNIRTELPEGPDERVDADGRVPVVKFLFTH